MQNPICFDIKSKEIKMELYVKKLRQKILALEYKSLYYFIFHVSKGGFSENTNGSRVPESMEIGHLTPICAFENLPFINHCGIPILW